MLRKEQDDDSRQLPLARYFESNRAATLRTTAAAAAAAVKQQRSYTCVRCPPGEIRQYN